MSKSILVIDDDEPLNALLKEYLARFGYRVSGAADPEKGLKALKLDPPDLVILDIMLPGKSGFDVCREIRAASSVPIIMLTARGDVADRIVGLELGADDYLPKPFEPRELAARIQSVLRRNEDVPKTRRIETGDVAIDLDRRSAGVRGKPVELTTMEFELLALFVRNPGIVLSRERIMDALRGLDWESFDRSADVLVSRLRRKLGDDPKHPKYVRAVRGSGYQFIGKDHDE
jgi:DNA-binding response OmpR family regulator